MPWKNFSEKEVPTKLQYEKSDSWIAHPTHLDLSKFLPDQNSISNTKKDVVGVWACSYEECCRLVYEDVLYVLIV